MADGDPIDDTQHRLTYATRAWEIWQQRAEAAEAQLAAVRAVLHKPEHLWQCGCCQAVLDALGDDA